MALSEKEDGHKLIDEMIFSESRISKQVSFSLDGNLIGVGAPTWAFLSKVGEKLREPALLPENAEVAGAVGAAVGSFSLEYSVRIMPVKGTDLHRIHYPIGIKDFDELDEAVEYANNFMNLWLKERAEKAGAKNPWIEIDRKDKTVLISQSGSLIYLYTDLIYEVIDKEE